MHGIYERIYVYNTVVVRVCVYNRLQQYKYQYMKLLGRGRRWALFFLLTDHWLIPDVGCAPHANHKEKKFDCCPLIPVGKVAVSDIMTRVPGCDFVVLMNNS